MDKSALFYNIKGFISSNTDIIYKKTESYDVEKYVILLIQIGLASFFLYLCTN
jgi:hypothetical protein